jgi:hypothetical protein
VEKSPSLDASQEFTLILWRNKLYTLFYWPRDILVWVFVRWLKSIAWTRADEPFRGRLPKLSVISFEEILSRAHGNLVGQNKVLEPSIIKINLCIVIINVGRVAQSV